MSGHHLSGFTGGRGLALFQEGNPPDQAEAGRQKIRIEKEGKMSAIKVSPPRYGRTMDDYGITEEDQEKLRDIAFKIGVALGIHHEAILERLLLCIMSCRWMDKRAEGGDDGGKPTSL